MLYEKKELIFEFLSTDTTSKRKVYLSVKYAANGAKTKSEDVLKSIRKIDGFKRLEIKHLEKMFGIFKTLLLELNKNSVTEISRKIKLVTVVLLTRII